MIYDKYNHLDICIPDSPIKYQFVSLSDDVETKETTELNHAIRTTTDEDVTRTIHSKTNDQIRCFSPILECKIIETA